MPRLGYQPSPHGFSKGFGSSKEASHRGFTLVAHRQVPGWGTDQEHWFAMAPEYDPDYLAVGKTPREAFAAIKAVLDEEIPPRSKMNPALKKEVRKLLRLAESQGCTWKLKRGGHYQVRCPSGKIVHIGATPRRLDSAKGDLRRAGVEINPSEKAHGSRAKAYLRRAQHSLRKASKARDLKGAFNASLDAIKHAASAYTEAEGAGLDDLADMATDLGDVAITRTGEIIHKAGAVLNPADIPGGNMSACIAIMEARPDVDSPGALCNWLARRSGEYGGGPRIPRKKKKLKPEQAAVLRKAMRGT